MQNSNSSAWPGTLPVQGQGQVVLLHETFLSSVASASTFDICHVHIFLTLAKKDYPGRRSYDRVGRTKAIKDESTTTNYPLRDDSDITSLSRPKVQILTKIKPTQHAQRSNNNNKKKQNNIEILP